MASDELTDKQKAFVEAYLANGFNATQAARIAGYSGDDNALAVRGSETVRNRKVADLIQQRIAGMAMDADEVLARLSEHARGSIAEFLTLPVDEIAAHPRAHLLKKVKRTIRTTKDNETYETIEFEMHDPQAALVHMGRYHKLFVDRVQQDDWRSEAVNLIRQGEVGFEPLAEEFGHDLAEELFKAAGVPVIQPRKAQ